MARRLLIAAGEAASHPEQLPFGVRELIDAAEEILVVTPTLPSSQNLATRPLARSEPTTPFSHSRTRSATSRPTTS